MLQTDSGLVNKQLRKQFTFWEEIDEKNGLKEKLAYAAKKNPYAGKEAEHGTFISNYSGRMDWGEVADYVESYVIIVEGHLLIEVTSMADKIFISFHQLIKDAKYTDAFNEVMNALGIPFKVEGPFPKNQTKHSLPKGNTKTGCYFYNENG